MKLDSSILEIKGIGEKTSKLFEKLSIYTIRDLLYHVPRDYDKYDKPVSVVEAKTGELTAIRCKIPFQNMELRKTGRVALLRFFIREEGRKVDITFFNMPFLKNILLQGKEYIFRGKLENRKGQFVMEQPKFYTPEEYGQYLNTLQPVYSLTKGLTSKFIQKAVREVLSQSELFEELLPDSICNKYKLMNRREAFYNLHFPKDESIVLEARRRLVFEEFLAFCLMMKKRKEEDLSLPFSPPLLLTPFTEGLLENLPYSLTKAQYKAWKQIEADMVSETAMNRMIQGDVGSGKTILAILALVLTAANGRQGVLMAPTEVLASQHYENISEMAEQYNLPVRPVLLVGSLTAKQKRNIYEKIETGFANVIIGTHALIQDKVTYHDLALVITDEQHRFGVRQRQILQEKGINPHLCVMSATPIPRTLAIVMFGDLNLSILDEMPVGRLPIKNCVVAPSYRETAYKFMLGEIQKGHQVYCICPMVEPQEMDGLENVVDYTDKLRDFFGERARIDYLHGKMKPQAKNKIMEDFALRRIDILVSTTVIEVGINVPNATVMMVENAERFGLAQLHQLRGRVGRGSDQSYCIFINSNGNENTSKRLSLLNQSNDGFFLANEDMRLRGPGDIFGIRQSGEFVFEIGDIYNDADLLINTAALADDILLYHNPEEYFPKIKRFCLEAGNQIDFRSI